MDNLKERDIKFLANLFENHNNAQSTPDAILITLKTVLGFFKRESYSEEEIKITREGLERLIAELNSADMLAQIWIHLKTNEPTNTI